MQDLFRPASYEDPWISTLLFSRASPPESGERNLATILLIEEISNSLCDLLRLERIPQHLLPTLTITEEPYAPLGQYFSFWKFRRCLDSPPMAPHITIHENASTEVLVEEITHFIFDYYHLKNSDNSHDVSAYQFFSDMPLYQSGSFSPSGPFFSSDLEELIFTNVFFAYLECIAATGTRLFFKNAQPEFGILDVCIEHEDNDALLKIGDKHSLPLGSALEISAVSPIMWPMPFAKNVYKRGIFDVVTECEYHLHTFTTELENSLSQLPEDRNKRIIIQELAQIIPSLRSDYIHAIGYSVASACAERIIRKPNVIQTFKDISTAPPTSLDETFKSLTSLAFD